MDYLSNAESLEYPVVQLWKDGETVWGGVTNPATAKHLREMQAGDQLVI
jgi:predicted RNA-binding protein with PUA-like domain